MTGRQALAWGALGGGFAGAIMLLLLVWLRPPLSPEAAALPGPAPAPAAEARAPTATNAAALADMPCWFAPPPGRQARCATLTVPEDWAAAQGSRALKLRVVVFRAETRAAADPIIYIPGGPGEPAQIDPSSIGYWWSWIGRTDWLRQRDVVVFDPRGVGLSGPTMNCPELAPAAYRAFLGAMPLDQADALWSAAAAQCHERLAALGIDLAAYNTAAMAKDLHGLIRALGYSSWNLLATSYGTRVALRFIDREAEGTRAVILDSVYPPEATAYIDDGAAAARAFALVFRECDEDRACRTANPDLENRFDQLLRRAAVTPLAVEIADPRGGASLTARLDDAKLVEVLLYAFYDWRRIGELPAIITAAAGGDTRSLAGLTSMAFANYVSDKLSHGVYLSAECHDEYPFNTREAVYRAAAEVPLYRSFALSSLPFVACAAWPVGQASAADRKPISSSVPVLMLAGELDPVTPVRWAKLAAGHLRHAFLLEFRGVGHGVLAAHACASRVAGRFLADPRRAPVDDCLLALRPPRFQATLSGG